MFVCKLIWKSLHFIQSTSQNSEHVVLSGTYIFQIKIKGSKKENYFWGAFYDVSKQKLETEWQICGRHAVFDGGINVLHLL